MRFWLIIENVTPPSHLWWSDMHMLYFNLFIALSYKYIMSLNNSIYMLYAYNKAFIILKVIDKHFSDYEY